MKVICAKKQPAELKTRGCGSGHFSHQEGSDCGKRRGGNH